MSYGKRTWRIMIGFALEEAGEADYDIVAITLTDQQLDEEFDTGGGVVVGAPFTAWTVARVYFPICHDGSEECASVSRHPDGKPTPHIGV